MIAYPSATAPAMAFGSGPPRVNLPATPVELHVSAKNLLDADILSKSDPVCILYMKDNRTNSYMEVGRTERIKNNLNPSWNKKFIVDYHFEERQILKFSIYDWDSGTLNLAEQDYLGCLECSLGEIVAAPNKKFERSLELPPKYIGKTKSASSLVVVAEELGSSKEVLHLKLCGRKLDKKDFLGKSDPYLLISKLLDDGTYSDIHKTEIIKNNLNPEWKQFTIRVASLTGGKPDRILRFQVSDWNRDGSSDLIGQFETTFTELVAAANENRGSFNLINPIKKAKKRKYTNSGLLNINWLRVVEEKSFVDHIQSGVQLHFTVAIDFTASNGDPNHPQSLHYRNPSADNQYSLAIKSVGEIIQDYDSDKMFPGLGFGARIPPHGVVSHEFCLNGNPQSPFCQGVAGILEAYHQSLNTVTLFGPTYFAPVINHVARFASSYQDGRNYFVLLIITDGIICDMDATKVAVIQASQLPLSIIIIGVGNEDFSAMEFLDSDSKLLSHNGRTAVRDIVQFVEMRKFYSTGAQYGTLMYPQSQAQPYNPQFNPAASIMSHSSANVISKANLARAVLAELPDQLVLWMKRLRPVI